MLAPLVLAWLVGLHTSVATDTALILTPYLEQGRIKEARKLAEVTPSHFLGTKSYSGFFTVDKKYNSHYFFWYFPVTGKPVEKTPWIVWLQGGPGSSSLTGLFEEVGPFMYDVVNNKLKVREHAWTKHYSMVFIDNPVGAGYSFTNNINGFARNVDTCTAHLFEALQQFLVMYKELEEAPLYIAGESYAGIYLPYIGIKIFNESNNNSSLRVNLAGIIMGNPILNRMAFTNYTQNYYKWGLKDVQGESAAQTLQTAYVNAIVKNDTRQVRVLRNALVDKLKELSQQVYLYNILSTAKGVGLDQYVQFLKQKHIRNALHVGPFKFSFSSDIARHLITLDFFAEGATYTMELLNKYNVMIVCGLLDLIISCVDDAYNRRVNWHWDHVDSFLNARMFHWVLNNSEVGFTKQGGHLTEIMVIKAGHMVARDMPAEMLIAVRSFIEGKAHSDIIADTKNNPKLLKREGDVVIRKKNSKQLIYQIAEILIIRDVFLIVILINIPLVICIVRLYKLWFQDI